MVIGLTFTANRALNEEGQLLHWVLEKISRDPYVVIEYYGEFDGLKAAYRELDCGPN